MAKVALLIGIGEYGSGLNPLPDAVKDVEAVQQVLQSLKMSGFDEVKQLSNPNPPVMREALETLFSGRTQDDLVLLFFSGHIVWDDSSKLYFATAITPKSPRAELIRVSAIPISFVHDLISQSPCQHHIIILDCCLNLVSAPEIATSAEQTLELQSLLGGKRQSILACFTPIQDSLEPGDYPHSIYTRYLVEGIKTGAADLNHEGWISVRELHEYANQRTQIAAPLLKPEFYSTDGGDKMLLFKSSLDDPNLKYRRAVDSWVSEGNISPTGRSSLNKLAESIGITSQECNVIEAEVLKPYHEYQEKLQQYKRELAKVISYDYPLATPERKQLRLVQQCLGLREQDVAPIEEEMTLKLARLHQAEDEADKLTPVHSDSQPVVASSGQKTVLQHSTRLLPIQPAPPTPAGNLSSNSAESTTNSPSASPFPYKFLLPLGIGGVLVVVALAIGISRTSVTSPANLEDRVSSSASSSSQSSPTVKNLNQKTSPTPSRSPKSQNCMIFVNGNLRSEPVSLESEVIESFKGSVSVTGKRTDKGWIQVKLSSGKLAWAHPDIISSASEREMETCLAAQKNSN